MLLCGFEGGDVEKYLLISTKTYGKKCGGDRF